MGKNYTVWKVFKYGVFSGPYFLVFGLNTLIYDSKGCETGKFNISKPLF